MGAAYASNSSIQKFFSYPFFQIELLYIYLAVHNMCTHTHLYLQDEKKRRPQKHILQTCRIHIVERGPEALFIKDEYYAPDATIIYFSWPLNLSVIDRVVRVLFDKLDLLYTRVEIGIFFSCVCFWALLPFRNRAMSVDGWYFILYKFNKKKQCEKFFSIVVYFSFWFFSTQL